MEGKRIKLNLAVVIWLLLTSTAVYASEMLIPERWIGGKAAKREGRMLVAKIPEKSEVGDLLQGLKTPLKLKPGIYQVNAVVKPEPLQNMAYRIILTVRSAKSAVQYKRWRPQKDQLTPRPKEIWHAVAEARAFQHDDQGLVHLKAVFAVTEEHEYQIAIGWKMGENQAKWENAPVSLKQLALISLSWEKLKRQVLIEKLILDKVVYKPGMQPKLTATLIYTGKTDKSYHYQVRMTRDLEPAVIVKKGKFTAKPGKSSLRVILPKLAIFGGYRFDLELLDGDKVVQSRERSAACSRRYNRIGISGVHHGEYLYGSVNATKEAVRYAFENARDDYISWFEVGFWAPDDFQNLTPEKEKFISNVMGNQRRSHIKYICEAGQRYGIGVYAYLKGNYADGRDGLLWAQKYPELVYYHRDTGRPMGQYNLDHILNWDDYEDRIVNRRERIGLHWYYIRLDPGRPSIVDISAAETIATAKMFGWAGVRFDGDFDVPVPDQYYQGPVRNMKGKPTANEDDAEITYANNVRRYKKKIREVFPDFEFGFNHVLDDSHQRWIVGPAIASDESMVMNEPIRGFGHSKERAYNRWEDFSRMLVKYSRIVRSWGGFYQPIGCYGMRADDYLYQSIYVLAAQAKPYGPYFFNTPFTNRLSRFVTRFAGIMCADLYPVPAPEGRITIKSSGPLQWQRYVNFREVSPTRRDYIIQMINPPVPERAKSEDTRCLLREPVREVKISFDLDPFEVPVKAWLLDPWDENDMTPVELNPRPGGVDLKLPRPVSIWSVLVIRCDLEETR